MSKNVCIPMETLRLMVISSLRYGLGRATYITSATADVLRELPKGVWDERTLSCALVDLKNCLDEWDAGYKPNMDCDHDAWASLYDYLLSIGGAKCEE